MLVFKNIYCRNFMSVGNDGISFDYKTGLFYCYGINHDVSSDIDGTPISNGSGKTVCLVDAPLFALYGRTQRNINKAQVINVQNSSDCLVRLTFEKDGIEYTIERGLKPDKILIYKNGEAEKEEAKKREANKVIVEEILDGISFEVFKNLIVLNGTSSKHFFEYGKNEKRTFINEVFRLGFLDYLQDNLTEEVKDKKNKLEVLNIQKNSKEKEVERLKGLIDATESGDVLDIALQDVQAKLLEESKKLEDSKNAVFHLETKVFNNDIKKYHEMYNSANLKYEDTDKEIVKCDFFINDFKKQLDKLREDWNRVTKQNICVHCTQSIPESLKQKLQEEIKNSANKIKKELEEYTKNKENKTANLIKMKIWIDQARKSIEDYETKTANITHSHLLIEQYENQLKVRTNAPANLEKLNEEILNAENELKSIVHSYQIMNNDYIIHKVCRDIVSDKNFYGHYISVFREYLNQTINQYLNKLASPHRVQFNTDLEAEVSDGDLRIHSYDNLSTGEKAKINLSLLLSFFDVLNAFHRMQTSILVLDEVLDTGIDSEGIKLLHSILKEKVSNNNHLGIYVVSHKNAESSFTEQEGINKVVFQKRNGFTEVQKMS